MNQRFVTRLARALLVAQGLLGLAAVAGVLVDMHTGTSRTEIAARVPADAQRG